MRRLTIMIVPDERGSTRQIRLPYWLCKGAPWLGLLAVAVLGFLTFDYAQLLGIRASYQQIALENEGLKGEARVLMGNLEDVKRSLRRVKEYTTKLDEITQLRVQKVSKKTGLGPLTHEEFAASQKQIGSEAPKGFVPLGVNMDSLVFRPVLDQLNTVGEEATAQALELQRVLSSLSQQKSLLSSIPSILPVNGWIASSFGSRVSPFTGETGLHQGLDIAAPHGTPIYSPADGVVVFTGAKAGFGNFIIVAHGYGLVTRYGHNAENLVEPGQRVKRGEQIATVGDTGRTTGPHLHYEVWVNNHTTDPKRFLLESVSDTALAF